MKKIILVLSIVLAVVPALIISCSKSKETQASGEAVVSVISDYEKVVAISNDDDWKTITANGLPFISKLVKSADFNTIDLSKKENLLRITELTNEEYDAMVAANRAAAERLIRRYNLLQNDQAKCLPCTLTPQQINARARHVINYFKKNSEEYDEFSNFLQSYLQPVEKVVDPGGGGGCPIAYFVCVAGCLASPEPIHTVCLIFCYEFYCKPVGA